jgi:hypothetical protein
MGPRLRLSVGRHECWGFKYRKERRGAGCNDGYCSGIPEGRGRGDMGCWPGPSPALHRLRLGTTHPYPPHFTARRLPDPPCTKFTPALLPTFLPTTPRWGCTRNPLLKALSSRGRITFRNHTIRTTLSAAAAHTHATTPRRGHGHASAPAAPTPGTRPPAATRPPPPKHNT